LPQNLKPIEQEILKPINLLKIKNLEFKKIKKSKYKIWEIKDELLKNENLGVVLNASNEVAVEKFLKGEIDFLDIANISLKAINKFNNVKIKTIDDIFSINKAVRRFCK
jgi:1-deoxy-D-xylulose-5-phosphate reductoisomerase